MIDIKKAASIANQYMVDLLGLTNVQASEVRLEEVEGNDSAWLITLSFPNLEAQPAWKRRREYKIFSIDKNSGEILFMKIRQLENA